MAQTFDKKELKRMKQTLRPYQYSNKEIGKDKSVNPNYYKDQNGDHMLMWHMSEIFPRTYTIGFLIFTIIKYLKRFPKKDYIQDLYKAMTNLKFLVKFVEHKADFKQ